LISIKAFIEERKIKMSISDETDTKPLPTVGDLVTKNNIGSPYSKATTSQVKTKPVKSRAAALISLAQTSIQNGQKQVFLKIMSGFPMEKLDEKITKSLFIRFTTTAARYNQGWAINSIFNIWKRTYPDDQKVSFFTSLFLTPFLNRDIFQFVVINRPQNTFLEVITELNKYDSNSQTIVACAKAVEVFAIDKQPEEKRRFIYKVLVDLSNRGNESVHNYFLNKLSKVSLYVTKPTWLKQIPTFVFSDVETPDIITHGKTTVPDGYPPRPKIPTEKQVLSKLPPVLQLTKPPSFTQMADALAQKYQNSGMTEIQKKQALEVMTSVLLASTPVQRAKLMNEDLLIKERVSTTVDPVKLELTNKELFDKERRDRLVFQILGPANPLIDATSEEMIYGGERMFSSYYYDNEGDDEFVDIVDWFTGSCQQCIGRLRNRWHAVRMPRPYGGWKGCYCSWKCVSEQLNTYQTPEMATSYMITIFESQMKEFGIQDRIVPPNVKALSIMKINDFIESRQSQGELLGRPIEHQEVTDIKGITDTFGDTVLKSLDTPDGELLIKPIATLSGKR